MMEKDNIDFKIDQGMILLMDINSIPTKHNRDLKEWLRYAKKGIIFYDGSSYSGGKEPEIINEKEIQGIKFIDINNLTEEELKNLEIK